VNEHEATLRLHVVPGPLVDLVFEGAEPPQDVRDAVRMQWHRGIFDVQRGDDGREVLRAWLMSGRHLQPKVSYEVREDSGDRRQAVFRIDRGPKAERVVLAFDGASQIPPDDLDEIIESQHLEQQLFTDPVVVTELLEQYYREEGYVAADVDAPRYEFEGALARVVLPIREGPRFHVRTVSMRGNAVMATHLLLSRLPLGAGDPFLPAAAENGLRSLRDQYWRGGYNDVRLDYELVIDRPAGAVDVEFTIEEGPQSVIADIAIEGNVEASHRLVREQLELSAWQSLDLGALSRSRRNLYDTGAFSVVDITHQELAGDVPAGAAAGDQRSDVDQKPVQLSVAVREVQPIQLSYGAAYDSERGLGGVFEIANHNSLGKARVIGLATRYDSQVREARGSMSQPSLRYWPIRTTVSVYHREERNPATELTDGFDVSRRGFSILQERELRQSYVWSYGYRYERARTHGAVEGSGLDQTVVVSPVTSTLTREARDEMLDATRGSFTAHALSYSPSWLGADRPFLKYYGQYFRYFPLQSPRRKPFSTEILRPRFVYAAGVRFGMARGLTGPLSASERFFAGGGTTLRGFAQNAVGPIDDNRVPTGGEALLVVNNEVRFPLVSIVDGVLFADIGNVFNRVADLSLRDLRESAGVGVRLRTPWFLLRGDYGFVLDARPEEVRRRFYFSIGQAF
jgi:outer membrane protein assembly complex protein YaeT